MLYFSKLRIFSVLIFTVILSYFTISNFIKFDDNFFSKKYKIRFRFARWILFILEIDNKPVVTQKLQNKVMELKKFFKEKNIVTKNFSVNENSISF